MGNPSGPLIVRRPAPPVSSAGRPGLHSHNRTRRMPGTQGKEGSLLRLRLSLLIVGLAALGYYGYAACNEFIYQAYENWAFDQQIAGRRVAFDDYVREETPLGFLAGTKIPAAPAGHSLAAPQEGSLLGRIKVDRLNLSAMVREGVDAKTLSLAVGHVPSTALPGQAGNFAIAAHRDTLFRGLKDIRKDDLVTFQSPDGTYTYRVVATEIVKPSDVSVLEPNGGGLIALPAKLKSAEKLLTMITCYPFYYVGSAPKRFIVEAKLVSSDSENKFSGNEAQNTGPPVTLAPPASPSFAAKRKPIRQSEIKEPRPVRGSSHVKPRPAKRLESGAPNATRAAKKHSFWHKLWHL